MIKYFAIAFLSVFAILSSCTEAQEDSSTEQLLKQIEETVPRASEQDDQILFWKNMLDQERYASNKITKAHIYSYIAQSFGRSNIDSTEMYATNALILIEDVVYRYLLKISIQKGKKNEADSIISKLSEMEQDTIRFIFLKLC